MNFNLTKIMEVAFVLAMLAITLNQGGQFYRDCCAPISTPGKKR